MFIIVDSATPARFFVLVSLLQIVFKSPNTGICSSICQLLLILNIDILHKCITILLIHISANFETKETIPDDIPDEIPETKETIPDATSLYSLRLHKTGRRQRCRNKERRGEEER